MEKINLQQLIETSLSETPQLNETDEIEKAARDFYWKRQPKGTFMAENSRPDMVIGFVEGVRWYKEKIKQ